MERTAAPDGPADGVVAGKQAMTGVEAALGVGEFLETGWFGRWTGAAVAGAKAAVAGVRSGAPGLHCAFVPSNATAPTVDPQLDFA